MMHLFQSRCRVAIGCVLVWIASHPLMGAVPTRTVLMDEHTDLRILYTAGVPASLRLVARDEDRGINHPATNVVMKVPESARFELPPGTPFGNEGDPLWILPQNQFPGILYLGISAEQLPADAFGGPITLRLTRVEGPGRFIVWQAVGFGDFRIQFDSKDGLDGSDALQPLIGSHGHYNWGFSAPGVFAVTFEMEVVSAGGGGVIRSLPFTFLFHVEPLPLPPTYAEWSRRYWHPELLPSVGAHGADPDADGIDNLTEYASGTDPCDASSGMAPSFERVQSGGSTHASYRFQRRAGPADFVLTPECAPALEGPWTPMDVLVEGVEEGDAPVLWRYQDALPWASQSARFHRIRPAPVTSP